jgi:hypothetical protein
MSRRFFKACFAIFLVWLSLYSFAPVARAGFGISPAGLTLKDVLRGTTIEKVIVLSRNNPNEDLLIQAQAEGKVADWVQLERGNQFTYPAGEKQFPVKVTINIPRTTANGTYTGSIRFTGSSPQSCEGGDCQGSSVGVATGALADVEVIVTDKEIRSFRILGIQVDKARANEKLALVLFLENDGNVNIQPDHIVVDLFDKFHKMQLGSFTVSKFDGEVMPQNSGPVKAIIPWIPEIENYWAEVSVFNYKNQLITKESLAFEVEKSGAETDQNGLGAGLIKSNKTVLIIILATLGGLAFLGLAFWFFNRHLKKSFKSQLELQKQLEALKKQSEEISNSQNQSVNNDISKDDKQSKK